jgi:hypothetical protein
MELTVMSGTGLTENWTEGDRAIHRFREASREAERIKAAKRLVKQGTETTLLIDEEEARRIEAELDEASGCLQGIILESARRVIASFSARRQFCADFLNDAVSHIWERLGIFIMNKAAFEAWCDRVLRNYCISRYRRRRLEGPTGVPSDPETPWFPEPVDPQWQRMRELLERRIDSLDPFSSDDLQILETMPVLKRIIVLSLAGWFPAAGANWRKWLGETGIDGSFPPQELLCEDDFRSRIRLLAKVLDMKEDTVRQHWYRGGVQKLRDLEYGRERM